MTTYLTRLLSATRHGLHGTYWIGKCHGATMLAVMAASNYRICNVFKEDILPNVMAILKICSCLIYLSFICYVTLIEFRNITFNNCCYVHKTEGPDFGFLASAFVMWIFFVLMPQPRNTCFQLTTHSKFDDAIRFHHTPYLVFIITKHARCFL
jgi:hypothetical protein